MQFFSPLLMRSSHIVDEFSIRLYIDISLLLGPIIQFASNHTTFLTSQI